MKRKQLTIIVASALLACLLLVGFAGCSDKSARKSDSFVRLDINPSIELVVDANNKVVSVYGANTDGTVLLYGEKANVVGKDFEEALALITDEAVKLGYLSEENKVVQYTVSSPDGEKAEKELAASIDAKVIATSKSLGLTVTTDGSGAYSLLRRYNEYKESHPDSEIAQKMSVAEFRLALSAAETGEITLDAAIELNDEELVAMIKTAGENAKEFATNQYLAAKIAAEKVYEAAVSAALDGIYATYYSSHFTSHPSTWYYGYVYQMYATAAHGTKALEGMFMLKEKISIAVRKTAHITEFFLLGALFLLRFRLYGAGNMRAALYSASACLFLAVFDEYHQTFIPGRYGCLEDVLVDFFGVVSGILLCAAVIALVLRIKNKKTKKELSSV